jgi:hypothetical protein
MKPSGAIIGCATVLLLRAGAADAQGRHTVTLRSATVLGLGYVASVPTTPLGMTALVLTPKLFHGAGLIADVKVTRNSPSSGSDYLPTVTVQQAEVTYGDMLVHDQSDWTTVDLGGVYAITGDFAVYAGAGYSKETHYRQYFDQTESRGDFGFYWVSDPAQSGTRVNAMVGFFTRVQSWLYFQTGVESSPTAANVGLTFVLAR